MASSILLARRGDRRARVRGRRRLRRGRAPRHALSLRHRHRRLGALDADAADPRRRAERPALREGLRRGNGLRAEGADGCAAALRRAGARRARGARPAAAVRSRSRRWSCSGCSATRRRSRSTCSSARARRSGSSTGATASSRSSRGSPRPSALEDDQREAGFRLLGDLADTLASRRTKKARAVAARAFETFCRRPCLLDRASSVDLGRPADGALERVRLDVARRRAPRRRCRAESSLEAVSRSASLRLYLSSSRRVSSDICSSSRWLDALLI